MPKQKLVCEVCGKEFERYVYGPMKRCFCSKGCMGVGNIGENNPNFGVAWTDEQKLRTSKERTKFFQENPEIAHQCGSANRGKKFSDELIEKMHSSRTRESYVRVHSDETRKLIGVGSSSKWTDEYKVKNRKVREENGVWIPLSQKSDWEIYQKEADWIKRMFDIIVDPRNLLKTHGVFNCKTNSKGVVRDHIYSRKSGFMNKIFPEILRHPANCQVLLHSENVKKKTTRYVDADGYTIDELFDAIKNYSGVWEEHAFVIELVKKYEEGVRYERTIASTTYKGG